MSRSIGYPNTFMLKIPGTGQGWKGILFLAAIAGAAVIFFAGNKNIIKLIALDRDCKRTAIQIEEIKTSNQRLKRQIQDLRVNPLAVEPVAREEMGMVSPGEMVYRFIPPRPETGRRD